MTALGEVGTFTEILPAIGVKVLQSVQGEIDSDDTFTLDLSDYGCTNIHGILGFAETTTGSVVVAEAPTTSVSSSTLTVTVGGSSEDGTVRTYIIYAY